jgi:hypothetical protein
MAAERDGINGIMVGQRGDDLIAGERRDVRGAARGRSVPMFWLIHRNQRDSSRVQILLSAALQQNGWRIVHASPEEQAMLDAHGFGRGWVQ